MVISLSVHDDKDPALLFGITLPATAVFSIFLMRFIMTLAANSATTDKMPFCTFLYSVLGFWTWDPIISRKSKHNLCDEVVNLDDEKKSDATYEMVYLNYCAK